MHEAPIKNDTSLACKEKNPVFSSSLSVTACSLIAKHSQSGKFLTTTRSMFVSSKKGLHWILVVVASASLVRARSIGVRQACFNYGEAIEIDFDNTGLPGPDPDLADWIGLTTPATLDVASLDPRPIMWMWACGDQDCAFAALDGTVVFGPGQPDESGVDSWPLDAGQYVAFLTGGSSPYQARALSIDFQVMPEGQFCTGTQPQENLPIPTEKTPILTNIPTPFPTRFPTRTPTKPPTPFPTRSPTRTPTRGPTPIPTPQRTTAPIRAPTPTPTNAPTRSPTPGPTEPIPIVTPDRVEVSQRSGMSGVVRNARSDIRRIIASESRLAPKFLRLVFHDCVGGCDGTYSQHM